MDLNQYKYSAFISYSHSDSKWAEWLHRSLEKYSIPKSLQKEKSLNLPKSLYPVFRDREDLPTAAGLGEHITSALKASRYLIVICSPHSAQSEWVNEEIRTFKALGGADRVLCLIVDGEPFAGNVPGQKSKINSHPLRRASDIPTPGAKERSRQLHRATSTKNLELQECFPLAVRYDVGLDKQLLSTQTEPIAADAREGHDGKKLALLKLIAGLLSIDLTLLSQRESRRRANQLKLFAMLMLMLVVAFAGIALKASIAQKRAEALSLVALSRQLSVNADRLYDSENSLRVNMLLAGVQAHNFAPTLEARSASLKVFLKTRAIKSILSTESAIMNLVYSADGKLLATATRDNQIQLWDVETMNPQGGPLIGHKDSVLAVAFSPDGKLLVSGSVDGTVNVWDLSTVRPKAAPLTGHNDWVVGVDFTPDGRHFASSSWDGRVIIWDVSTLEPAFEPKLGDRGWASSLDFSPDGRFLAVGREDGTVELLDMVTTDLSGKELVGHNDWVTDVSFSHDSRYLASSSSDGTIQVWDIETRSPRYGTPLGHSKGVASAAFSPDDQVLVSGGWDRTVELWDTESGVRYADPLSGHTEQITSIAFNPDGMSFATASIDGTIIVWAMGDDSQLKYNGPISSLEYSPDGTKLATVISDGILLLQDLTTEDSPRKLLHKDINMITSLAFSQDGQRLAVSGDQHTLYQYDPTSLTSVAAPINLTRDTITSLAYSPDNRSIAIGDRNSSVQLWQLEPVQLMATLTAHRGPITGLSFSANGQVLASTSEDSQVILWNLKDGADAEITTLRGHSATVTTVVFQPGSNNIIASGSEDGVLIFWDLQKAEPIRAKIKAHDGSINSLAFSLDAQFVATGGSDMRVSLRDAKAYKQIGPQLEGHYDQVSAVSFSPDSHHLVSGSADGSVYFWDIDIEHWKQNICQKVVQHLTPEEWVLHIGEFFPYQDACLDSRKNGL